MKFVRFTLIAAFIIAILCNQAMVTNGMDYHDYIFVMQFEEMEVIEEIKLYDVPLSEELQLYIREKCSYYNVDERLVYAIIQKESNFRADVISKTNDYGLMQINTINHATLKQILGITDFLDQENNVLAGIYMISQVQKQFDEVHHVLMAYNLGPTGAKRQIAKGNNQTTYSKSVIEIMEEMRLIDKWQ